MSLVITGLSLMVRAALTTMLLGCIGVVLWFIGHGAGTLLAIPFGAMFR